MNIETIKKLKGLHLKEDIAKALKIKESTANNVISKLKKERYLIVWGKKIPRIYRISPIKQLPRKKGMYDVINKYTRMKVMEAFDHQVHGEYGPEDAIVDALKSQSFRLIMASMYLFNHVTDWKKIYRKAKKEGVWQRTGALYDVARMYFRTRRMPKKYRKSLFKKKDYLIKKYKTEDKRYFKIRAKWNVEIPFLKGDITKVKYDNT